MISFKNIQKTEGGPDRSVSDNQSSSVTLNELAMMAKITNCNFEFQQKSHTMADINPKGVQMTKTVLRKYESKSIIPAFQHRNAAEGEGRISVRLESQAYTLDVETVCPF